MAKEKRTISKHEVFGILKSTIEILIDKGFTKKTIFDRLSENISGMSDYERRWWSLVSSEEGLINSEYFLNAIKNEFAKELSSPNTEPILTVEQRLANLEAGQKLILSNQEKILNILGNFNIDNG